MFKKVVVIDGKGHLLGRLASVVAKELLNGQHIVVVRCEDLNISGSLFRNRLKFMSFLRKHSNTNPRKHSQIHYRAPSKMFWRALRGMMPYKTPRGAASLDRLKVLDGVPAEYEKKKRMVVPAALRVLRLKPQRRFCRVGDLSGKVGWNNGELITRLEERRKERSAGFFTKKQELRKAYAKAEEEATKKMGAVEQKLLVETGHARC